MAEHEHGDKKQKSKGGVNPAAAALTGLAIGVAAGVAAAALSDKGNRDKAAKKMDDLSKQAKKTYRDTTSKADKIIEEYGGKLKNVMKEPETAANQAASEAKKMSRRAEEAVDSANQTIEAEIEEAADKVVDRADRAKN